MIYGSLKRPTLDRFSLVTHFSTGISLVACLILGLGGYLVFGEASQGNILNNFASSDTVINIARLCFAINMFLTIPLESFVCRQVILELMYPNYNHVPLLAHLTITCSIILTSMGIALATCDLGLVLELTVHSIVNSLSREAFQRLSWRIFYPPFVS
jgi:sodium-coupled neutral amino acid transporter 11